MLLWCVGVLFTLIVADGGGMLFVAGAGLTALMTVALGYKGARGLIALIHRITGAAIRR